jgi:hypothetical protein
MNGDPALWGGNYLITNELDMLGGAAMRAPRLNWAPIGMSTTSSPADKFTGRFDGGGKKLWNLYIERTSGACYNIGLFGYVEGAVLRNIVIASGSVQGYYDVGGIAGGARNSEISGCSNGAGITATADNAGGVMGYSYSSTITACYNTGVVTANDRAGGVAGYRHGGSITGCYNTGSVTAGAAVAGGVAGYIRGSGLITGCYNTGSVTANTNTAGGVAGLGFTGNITACYNTGAVTANNRAGGIMGYATNGSNITACYNTGAVTAYNDYAGGVAGETNGASTITGCYNSGAVTAYNNYAGGVAGYHTFAYITACYNTGAVTSPGAKKGGVLGYLFSATITKCYWLNLSSGGVSQGNGSTANDPQAKSFSSSDWPSFTTGWSAYEWTQSGDETNGKYWKSIGQWSSNPIDGSKSEFPKLYWE